MDDLLQVHPSEELPALIGIYLIALTESFSNNRESFASSHPCLFGVNNCHTTRQLFKHSGDLGTGLKFGRFGLHGSSQVKKLPPFSIILHAPPKRIGLATSTLFQVQEAFFGVYATMPKVTSYPPYILQTRLEYKIFLFFSPLKSTLRALLAGRY